MPVKRKSNVVNILTKIGEIDNAQVKIGILSPEGATPKVSQSSAGFTYDPKVSVAQAATWNEYGTPTIPARPAFRNTSRNPDVVAQFARMVERVFQDDKNPFEAMKDPANEMARLLRTNILDFDTPPNAPATVAKKGFNNPLIDTFQTLQMISWEVRIGARLERGD